MRCVKCGKMLKRRGQRHDCKSERMRRAPGVTAEVELMKRRNLQAIKIIGQRGGAPPPQQSTGGPESMVV